LREVAAADDIHIHLRTELTKLKAGTNGCRYTATLKHEPTFIDSDKCIGCQACINACPEKCIVRPKVALSAAVPMIDYASCRRSLGKDCSVCEEICPAAAISMSQHNSKSSIDVDTVVLATGYEPYDPTINASYGYGRVSNIITGTEADGWPACQTHRIYPMCWLKNRAGAPAPRGLQLLLRRMLSIRLKNCPINEVSEQRLRNYSLLHGHTGLWQRV
jgi:NAD-dependent dihydropyrimidine dehydrogenase PreA subunit